MAFGEAERVSKPRIPRSGHDNDQRTSRWQEMPDIQEPQDDKLSLSYENEVDMLNPLQGSYTM